MHEQGHSEDKSSCFYQTAWGLVVTKNLSCSALISCICTYLLFILYYSILMHPFALFRIERNRSIKIVTDVQYLSAMVHISVQRTISGHKFRTFHISNVPFFKLL